MDVGYRFTVCCGLASRLNLWEPRGARRRIDVVNRKIGSTLIAAALAVSATAAMACDRHGDAAAAKDAKAVVASGDAKGCDMPCCAKAKAAADAKGCPKNAGVTTAAVKKTEPAKSAAPVAPAVDPGTHR